VSRGARDHLPFLVYWTAALLIVLLAIAYNRQAQRCEARGGVLVRGMSASGWVCVNPGLPPEHAP
jgi:hypothetical protein